MILVYDIEFHKVLLNKMTKMVSTGTMDTRKARI